MGRLMRLLLVLLALLLPVCASAMTETEWNRQCWSKTRQSLTVYQKETNEPDAVWQAVGSLPAGTYVKRSSRNDEVGHMCINYWQNGSVATGYVQASPHPLENAGAYVQVVQSGFGIAVMNVPEAYLGDTDALRAYIKKNSPDCRLLEEHEKDDLEWGPGDSLHLKEDGSSNSSSDTENKKPSTSTKNKTNNKSTKKKTPEKLTLDISIETGDSLAAVTVKKLGVYESVIKLDKEESTVPTTQLRYETTADSENALAIICAKNTGEVILRPQQETTGRVTKCKTGRVALVIDKGKGWSKLWYDGHVGYVQNKYLQFIPMAESADDGIVGDKTAPMHLGTHRDTRVVTRVKKGTAVKILWQGDTWAEVAVDGWCGYIQLKYLAE